MAKTQRIRLKYSPVEAAEFLGISTEKLEELTQKGRVRQCTYGRERYYLGGELDSARNNLHGNVVNLETFPKPKKTKPKRPNAQDRLAAHTWYASHKFYVDQLVIDAEKSSSPKGPVCKEPENWEDYHWKWLLKQAS